MSKILVKKILLCYNLLIISLNYLKKNQTEVFDLQKEVHEDMKANFDKYPKKWGLKKPDTNIDHRRVPNLMVFFARKGTVKNISTDAKDYIPGDIVCWDLGGGITHIGIVSNRKSPDNKRYMIIHNIGQGQVLEDCLFRFKIIGHYQYKL